MPFMSGRIVKSSLEGTCGEEEALAYSLSVLHAHCEGCHDRHCVVSPDGLSSCGVTECSLPCGHRLHVCKMEEHRLICSQAKVPCTNQLYGCPLVLTRGKINAHIRVCPASVMRCVIEWNRWPMHSQEENIRAPLPLNNPHVKCAQLDVALALRDQRMLMESMKAPKRIRKVLQNPITQRYPGVPFENRSASVDSDCPSGTTSVTVSDDETDAPWESTRLPPGLKMSVCSKLYRATKQTSDSLSAALNVMSSHVSVQVKQDQLTEIREEHDGRSGRVNGEIGNEVINKMEHVKITCSLCHKSEPPSARDDQDKSDSKSSCDILTLNGLKLVPASGLFSKHVSDTDTAKMNCSTESGCECSMSPLSDISDLSDAVTVTEEVGDQLEAIYEKDIKLHELLGVSLNIECISKYIAKHPKMFTFLCAQDFRRDEYMWHFKNVHNDIHCGLNGVVEQRCPLAYLGCTYSYQRLVPGEPSARVVHSSLLESFGLLTDQESCLLSGPESCGPDLNVTNNAQTNSEKQTTDSLPEIPKHRLREATPEIITSHKFDSRIHVFPRFRNNSECDSLMSVSSQKYSEEWSTLLCLPVEVLIHMVSFLDGFSLCNVSLTCKLLRNVSCSLLTNKGMVTPVWEKVKVGSKISWQVSHKKWSFSTAFSPIYKWRYNNSSSMSEHLKVCAFNRVEDKIVPMENFSYTGGTTLDPEATYLQM